MRSPLWTELRRGAAPVTAFTIAVAGTWMLVVHPAAWAGQWAGLAGYLRDCLVVLCPLMVAAGAWQAGRESRRGMGELLAPQPRPAWQPLVVAWLAVSLGGTVGLLLPAVAGAVLVGRVATYGGSGWWWTTVVGVLGLWLASAFGMLAGRLVPVRVTAPIAGVLIYGCLTVLAWWDLTGGVWLSPAGAGWEAEKVLPPATHALQALWILALTATLLVLAGTRGWARTASSVPVAVAVTVAVPLVGAGPPVDAMRTDPAAVALACTADGPRVCVGRVNGFLLDDVASLVQPVLRRIEGVPGTPTRAIDNATMPLDPVQADSWPAGETLWFTLEEQANVLGGLANPDWLRYAFAPVSGASCEFGDSQDHRLAGQTPDVAEAWMLHQPPRTDTARPAAKRLTTLPQAEQKAWFGAYLAAARTCDEVALTKLSERLS